MHGNTRLIMTSLLGLLVVSLLLVPPARAGFVGNDDGEFDVSSTPSYVFLEEAFNTCCGLHWTSSPPYNDVSMQYNPDRDTSFWLQNGADWFQTVISSDPNGCAGFHIQVWNTVSGNLNWRADYPNTGCITVNQILNNNAVWFIREDVYNGDPRYSGMITDVYFSLTGSGSLSYTLYTGGHNGWWKWLRSNLCWCGTDNGYATFGPYAAGTSYMGSNVNVNAIGPPFDISTSENSNMAYSCFSNSGTHLMSQLFSAGGGHC